MHTARPTAITADDIFGPFFRPLAAGAFRTLGTVLILSEREQENEEPEVEPTPEADQNSDAPPGPLSLFSVFADVAVHALVSGLTTPPGSPDKPG